MLAARPAAQPARLAFPPPRHAHAQQHALFQVAAVAATSRQRLSARSVPRKKGGDGPLTSATRPTARPARPARAQPAADATASPSAAAMLPPAPHRVALFAAYASASLALSRTLPPPAAVALVATLWLGFVLAISFTEAWVKFKAPSLTRAAAVDAGRHVFAALNAVEAGLGVGLVTGLAAGRAGGAAARLAGVAVGVLGVGVAWLTPALDARARALIGAAAGAPPPPTPPTPAWLHGAYVAGEVAKALALAALVRLVGGPLVGADAGAGLAAAGRALAGAG